MAVAKTGADPVEIDPRDRRAAAEPMVVVEAAPNLYCVYSGERERYTVSLEPMACECDDWHYREPDGGCKHVRRVAMTLGEREIPDVGVDWTLPKQRERGL